MIPDVAENLKFVRGRINEALKKAGDLDRKVEIVAVTKTFDYTYIEKAIEAGIINIGENRLQEAVEKYSIIGNRATWHLVGHLQTNKVKKALPVFELIHSVDSGKLAEELNKRAAQIEKVQNILVQVNTSLENSKFGVEPEKAVDFALEILKYGSLNMKGFMTIGPFTDNESEIRKSFIMLRNIREKFDSQVDENKKVEFLSMGMTSDYEIAIEEGSNMIRIGSALFGPRYK